MSDTLDPAWAGIIGASIGAVSAILGGAVAPIVRDVLTRRAARRDNDTQGRRRIALEALEALDLASEDLEAARSKMVSLQKQVALIDPGSEFGTILLLAMVNERIEGVISRSMASSMGQSVILAWARSEKIMSVEAFIAQTSEIHDKIGPIDERSAKES